MIIPFIKNVNFFELAKFMKITKSSANNKPLYKLPNSSESLPLSTIISVNIPSIGKSAEPFTAGCLRDSTQEQIYNVSDHIALCYMGYIKHSISALEEWSAVIHLSGFTIPLQGTPDRGCDLVNSDDFHFHLYYYSYFSSYMEVVLQDGVQSPTIADNEFTRQYCALNGDRIRINVDRTWMQNNGIGRIFKIGVKNNTVYFYIDDTLIGYQAKTLSIDSINVGEFPQRLQYFDLQYHAYVYDIQDFSIYDKFIFDIPAYGYLSGNPPFIFNSNGKPLVSWSISGNTTQNGTPTPDNPIMPQGCGDLETSGVKAGQYKIPILSANTTMPVYLGEVESTRRIKKLVLTGEETYIADKTYSRFITAFPNAKIEGLRLTQVFCTHFISVYDGRPISEVPNNSIYSSDVAVDRFFIKTTDYTSADDFKDYLRQQYAAGTPVIVWYVLAEPETGIVNEPLMKIGDYVDTVSKAQAGVEIPTTNGSNTLSVDTTIQPSEVSIVYENKIP